MILSGVKNMNQDLEISFQTHNIFSYSIPVFIFVFNTGARLVRIRYRYLVKRLEEILNYQSTGTDESDNSLNAATTKAENNFKSCLQSSIH